MDKLIFKSIFNGKRLLKFFIQFILTVVMIAAIAFFTITTIFHMAWSRYETTITTGNEFRNISLSNICIVLQCEGVLITNATEEGEDRYFKRVDNKLVPDLDKNLTNYDKAFYNFTKNQRLILEGDGYKIFMNSDMFSAIIFNTFYMILAITIIPYTFLSVYFYLRKRKREILANRELKDSMELSLQRNITEMIHHELNAPIALLTAQVDELYVKQFGIRHEVAYEPITDEEKELFQLYQDIYFSIERVNSVLTTLSRSKHIKFNNGTVPLLLIIKNTESSVNAFKLEKIRVTINNPEILQKYSVVKSLGNGSMMNILHILYTNAIEAYANTLEISPVLENGKILALYIKDNGSGIKDQKGNYISDDRVFKNGFTTKIQIKEKSNFFKILFGKIETIDSGPRGIGLFMVRNLLVSNGGDISVAKTGPDGTTFKLILPVKETIYRH